MGNELVFSGTVVEILPVKVETAFYTVTFTVDRVWKGTASKRLTLYVWPATAEDARFEVGRQYVAIAHRLTNPEVRKTFGLSGSDAVAFTPVSCTDSTNLAPTLAGDLGLGYPPTK